MSNSIIGAGIIGLPFSFKEAVSSIKRMTSLVDLYSIGIWDGSDIIDHSYDPRGYV